MDESTKSQYEWVADTTEDDLWLIREALLFFIEAAKEINSPQSDYLEQAETLAEALGLTV